MIKKFKSVTSHALDLSPVTNCHTFSSDPLKRDILYGRPLIIIIIIIIITVLLYSTPSRLSTQERSQPNLVQTMSSQGQRKIEQSGPLVSDAVQQGDHSKMSDQPQRRHGAVGQRHQ